MALALFTGFELVYPTPHVIEFPGRAQVKLRFTPAHLYLAEYERSVVFTNREGRSLSAELFPDTGGYARSQLYEGRDGKLYLAGHFDVAVLDPSAASISVGSHDVPAGSKYLGAIDFVSKFGLRFLSPAESPEQRLSGGRD